MTELVPVSPVSREMRVALKDKSLQEVTQVLTGIATEEAPEDFPEVPKAIEATKEIRDAMRTLSKAFQTVVVEDRRTLSTEEIAALGEEYEALQKVEKLIGKRAEAVKEYVRTHQDVAAEEAGVAFPKDVVHNGNVIARATERDKNGHYILAAKGSPNDLEIPGTTLKFSNQFSSGRVSENLAEIDRMYTQGELTKDEYYAMTEVRRVPSAEKIKAFVLKSGRTDLLGRIVRRGRNSQALYLRGLKKS